MNNGRIKYDREYLNRIENRRGKEYDLGGKLIFEGEYINGIKNGKAKEYDDNSKLIFEGEYLNGVKNGKFREYNYNGNIKFEGEYKNGKKWNGKGYSYFIGLICSTDIEIKNGEGKGKEYFNGNLEFEGVYLDGERWIGKEYYSDGDLKAEYFNGIRKDYYKKESCIII